MDRKTATVYCASSPLIAPEFFKAAEELAMLLARQGVDIVYGAGRQGLMGCIADSILLHGGKATGVIPEFMVERDWCHKGLSRLIVTPDMHSRKETMAQAGEAAIALPGGCGTLEELLEIITWKQLGLYSHPIIILNTSGYYDPLLQMLQHAINNKFMQEKHAGLWYTASTPQEVIEALNTIEEWDVAIGKFTADKQS